MKLVINSEPSVASNLINDLLMRRGQILERKDISAGIVVKNQLKCQFFVKEMSYLKSLAAADGDILQYLS